MLWTVLQLVILVTHSHAARNHDESRVTVSCPEYQMGFGGSCYQLVAQRQSSFSAEAWCEEHGGHLAFIPNKDTQQFLQKYLDPEEDMWLGLSVFLLSPGALSWLDGSPITYSNWGSNPQPGAACGYILKNSGFRWEATTQCNKKLHFICQFESGRFIVCRSSQTTLQCGSGQVLIIDSGFYGRKNVHYCRAAFSPPTTATQCGWVDVGTSVAAHCHGSQSCQLADIVKSFDEPCPELGSYLSLDYHCKNVVLYYQFLFLFVLLSGNFVQLTANVNVCLNLQMTDKNLARHNCCLILQKNISDSLLVALDNTLSALLIFKDPDAEPITIQHANISVLVNRMTPGRLQKDVNIPNSSSSTFSLPDLPSNIFPSEEPVDIRMLSLNNNPFSWNERANISGQIAALSFTKTDGSSISVENLSKEIEILLPRPIGEQVETSVFDLGNFSTTVIDIHSTDSTLVLKMVPSKDPLPFKLFLGYLSYPTTTKYVAMTEMPHQGNTEEERYTWLLDPKSLKGNTGVHYLVVRPIVGPGIKSINASLSITSFTAACKFWNESTLDWSDTGCRVGPQTTQFFTQCLCNHLTFFGSSFFVTPNLIDPSRSAELFGTFAENPVVVCFVGSLFAAYLLVLVWARRKDIQDTAKVNVTVLVDNDPMDKYCYLISVSTGHRRGASTSSQVTVTLLGADGNSEPHHLTDQKKSVFERGAVDWFLLTTPLALGDLWEIRLWHNNSGGHPSWYVSNVTVQDLQTNQKWHFLCNSWLSIDIDDCCLDKVFPVSTEMDLKKFRNVFFMKTTKDFSDGHLWYSVISRPPNSTFTCVQRVSCCFSLLLCTMLTSIMFYGIPADPSEQNMDFGHFEFTLQQFMIGVQSSLIMFPVNILIVSIFRNTHPWDMSCCKNKTKKPDALEQEKNLRTPSPQIATANINVTLDTIIKVRGPFLYAATVIKINYFSLCIHMEGNQKKSNKAQYLYLLLCHIDKELSLLGSSGFPSPHSYSQALQQVQGMKRFLEDLLFTSNGDSGQKKKGYCHEGLPWWFIFIGWLLVIATSVVSGFFTMLYGLKFGKERSISWLVSMIVSFFQSILVIQPLKVRKAKIFHKITQISVKHMHTRIKCKFQLTDHQHQVLQPMTTSLPSGDCTGQQIFRRDKNLYEPPPPADIEKIKRNKMMEQKAFALLREILTYSCFIWMLLLVAYSQRDPNAFFLNQHIRDSFSEGISDSMSLDDVFKWLNTSLLGNLFGVYPGFITDGNSKLVGFARLRQLRVQKNSCEFADSVLQFVPDCHALYSREAEDTGSYGNAWNLSVMGNISTGTSSPWRYQTQAQLRAPPVWGKIMLYRGGGFVTELGPDMQNASSTLGYLYRSKWLDVYTQAFFVEFTVYNANVNLFCIVTLMFETSAVGAFQFRSELQSIRLYQSTGGFHIFVMAAEIIYMLFILYYMFLQGKLLKQQRWAYFRNKWNLLELAIILLSWSAMAIFIRRTLLGDRDMAYYQNHKDQFASFYESAMADLILQRLIAFLTLLATVKLWRLLRLNPNMNMITATLQRAWGDISGFLVIIVIAFLAYSIVCNMIYGWRISSYHTLADALLTIICLQIGIFNYDEVLDHNLLLGGLLFGSCIIMVTFVLLNILISVILGAFKQEQIHHKVKPVTKPLKPVMRLSESQNKFKCLICTVMTDTVQVKADT
uniref:Polycystic kidney disease 1 like 2a n=1 Tax=Echeneis naucrates TaxID=173247 RepID=A0A665VIF9_ECHNA